MPSFTSLAQEILAYAQRLDQYVVAEKLPSSSFDQDSISELPDHLETVRKDLINSTATLKQLAQGPVGAIAEKFLGWTDLLFLRAIYEFQIAQAVPLDGHATYTEIATKTAVPESFIRRFLRLALASHIFSSPTQDTVAHTAASRLLVTDSDFYDALGLETVELAPAAQRQIEAIRRHGDTGEPHHTGYSLENGMPIFEVLTKEPERGRRLGAGMRFFTKGEGWDLKHLAQGYNWSTIDQADTVVVDVGGGHGSVAQALVQATKNIHFVVQDLPGTVEEALKVLPAKFKQRIDFQAHDFFTEQPLKGAAVYLMRWITHDWSDKYCIKILQGLVPAMTPGAKIILFDAVLGEEPETRLTERLGIQMDMIMLSCFGGAERTRSDFERLLETADKRFTLEKVTKPEGSVMSIVEISWRG